MSDQNKFINAYVETSLSILHDYINQTIQLKSQLKVATDTLTQLQNEVQQVKTENTEKDSAIQKAAALEHANHSLQNKVSHLETALNQITEMKRMILQKDEAIRSLEMQIEELKKPVKKVINRKKHIQANTVSTAIVAKPDIIKTDDF